MHWMKEVVAAYEGVGNRWSVCLDVEFFLCGSCVGRPLLWVRYVRYFTDHWEDLGWITPQGGLQTDGASTEEGNGWYVGVPPAGGGEGGGVPT